MSDADGGSKYVVATGEGYHTTRTTGLTGVGISIADTDLDWQREDIVAVEQRGPHRLVVTPDPESADPLERLTVHRQQCRALHISLPNSVLGNLVTGVPDDIRVYEDENALVVVDAADDPRVPGGEDGGD